MKKILSAILAAVLLLSLMAPAFADDPAGLIYIYGGSSDKNRAKLKTMGQQSWYMMYSTQINMGAEIDLTTFKECVQTETGMWKPAESAIIPSQDPAKEGEDQTFNADWFNIRKDGFLGGDTAFSAGLKWVCEVDGVYDIAANLSGGSSNGYLTEGAYNADGYYNPASDGCYMSLWIKDEVVFCEDTWAYEGHRMPRVEMEFNGVELKAGDCIWLVNDTKTNGGWDDAWFHVIITRTGDLPQ